ncbi:MAG: hypothetical protein HUJ61_03155 [Bacilli bacterium]|nr:hypothetical protein [Bacilli bacterium]
MRKLLSFLLILLILPLCACNPKGGAIVFEATSLGKTAIREEKVIIIKGHEFIYFDVCSDSEGNFILASADAYLCNKDIQFGVRFKHITNVAIYDITNQENYTRLEPIATDYENGDWGYQVNLGFMIRQDLQLSSDCSPYNIGKITHWC